MEITKLDLDEYKEKLIEQQGYICPVTQAYIDVNDVDVIFLNGHDYAISFIGLTKLRDKFGVEYINDKIVYGMKQTTEDQVVRDQG